ncbi:MAG: hypothetical protein KBT10_09540, partial [Bacteroidales bacterium]|nr:hypothetical protein [Candidatus Sodaliphilus aphodohippi]
MKRTILILSALLGMAAAYAQSDDYLPIAREGSEWCYEGTEYYDNSCLYAIYRFEGDTIADGRYYKILNRYDKLLYTNPDGSYYLKDYKDLIHYALVHEEGKKVYVRSCPYQRNNSISGAGMG